MAGRREGGNNGDEETTPPLPPEQKMCSKQACAIQYCLARHDYQERYCKAFVDEWRKCRDRARRAAESSILNKDN
jgi:hypothetical protein